MMTTAAPLFIALAFFIGLVLGLSVGAQHLETLKRRQRGS